MEQLVLKPRRDLSVRRHHPWIFSGAVAAEPALAAGEIVAVMSAEGEGLGYGAYSPQSQIRVRMLSFDPAVTVDAALIRERTAAAVGRRADFFANAYTDAMRLVNAESDGLPGVVADYYAGFVVCQFTSAGAEHFKAAVVDALLKFVPFCQGVGERLDAEARAKEGLECVTVGGYRQLAGAEPPELLEIREGEVHFLVDVRKGHKTGFYLDQRDARATVGALANGAEVLNCFAYTGGFGLFARAAGALSVTQVDVSAEALKLARQNEALAHLCGTKLEYVEADVFEYLRRCRDARRQFDLIVLDPPKFAATRSQLMKAARGYKDINLLAMKLLRPNGHLATFSCSGAMTPEFFDQLLAEAAADAGREFQLVARTRQGSDHPVALAFPEGAYLKGNILRAIG